MLEITKSWPTFGNFYDAAFLFPGGIHSISIAPSLSKELAPTNAKEIIPALLEGELKNIAECESAVKETLMQGMITPYIRGIILHKVLLLTRMKKPRKELVEYLITILNKRVMLPWKLDLNIGYLLLGLLWSWDNR